MKGGATMRHEPPRTIAIAHCPTCARISLGRHVNQLDRVPPRYCRICGGALDVVLYELQPASGT